MAEAPGAATMAEDKSAECVKGGAVPPTNDVRAAPFVGGAVRFTAVDGPPPDERSGGSSSIIHFFSSLQKIKQNKGEKCSCGIFYSFFFSAKQDQNPNGGGQDALFFFFFQSVLHVNHTVAKSRV
jgi:hypothetical protein